MHAPTKSRTKNKSKSNPPTPAAPTFLPHPLFADPSASIHHVSGCHGLPAQRQAVPSAQPGDTALATPASPPHPPEASSPSLTSHLMDDLLDPTLTPVQICKAHALRLDQLADIMQTDAYRKSAAAIAQISTDRTTLITNHEALRARSLQQDIARDAYLAAADLNEATASRNPKLASTRARLL